MSSGALTTRECPGCRTDLSYLDFEQHPPPIPAALMPSSYADLNMFVTDEGERLWTCPHCGADLDAP